MGIEWQVVSQQADIMTQQRLDTTLFHTRKPGIFALPEKTVVNQQQVGIVPCRRIDQRLAGGNPANDPVYLGTALNLQAIGAIILESVRFQQAITVVNQFSQARQFRFSPPVYNAAHMNIRDTVSFFLQAATVGIVAAFLLLFFKPDWFDAGRSVIEVRQAPDHGVPAVAVPPSARPASYADAVEPAARAVVNIYTSKVITRKRHPLLDDPLFQHFFGDQLSTPRKRTQTSLGSGVIVSAQGYVLTNNHVIADADEIQVLLQDGRSSKAMVVGVDKDTDLAILRIKLDKLPSISIGSTSDLRVGDIALAIGNPYGVGQTVTLGIISATGRNQLGINRYEDFIQTDAAINPGNSGGALVNAWGELIGINTAIYSRSGGSQGIGFAIPADLVSNVMKQIIEQGHVDRGWLGIEAQDLTPALASSFGLEDIHGLLIAGVLRDGPADKAGILLGDVIERINGEEVVNARAAMSDIARSGPDIELKIEGVRDGRRFRTTAVTSRRPESRD